MCANKPRKQVQPCLRVRTGAKVFCAQTRPRLVENKVYFVPECVARVPVSLWGSGGCGCVRQELRLRSQPSVRNRLQPSSTAGGDAVRLSLCANATGVVQKVYQVDS